MNTPASAPGPAIVVHGLKKQFADQPLAAITELSMQVEQGSITGLVGPDGAGKTTLLPPCG